MTIKNFTEYLSKHELKKGEDYYRRKKVTKLKEEEPEEWTAIVNGRQPYEVEISLDEEDIIDVSCECIAHTDEEYCKHVIAVLFAIQEKEGLLKPVTGNELETIVNNLAVEELRFFLLDHAQKDQELKNDLVMYQELKDKEDKNVNRYCTLINHFIDEAIDGGSAKTDKINTLISTGSELLKKANKAYDEKKYLPAAEIVLAIVKTLPAATGKLKAVAAGNIKSTIAEGFSLLLKLISDTTDVDSNCTNLIVKHAYQHVKDEAWPLHEYKTHWIDLVAWCSLGAEEEVLKIIRELSESAANQKNTAITKRLADLKKFVEEPEEETAAPDTTATDKSADIKSKIEAAVKSKKYKEAKQMAEKAMQQAKSKKDMARYEEIKFTLMSALQRSSDVLGLRELARRFYEETRDTRYYAMWKGTHIQSEWERTAAELIEKLERNIFAYAAGKGDPGELAFVYVEEYGYDKSLLNLLKKAPRLPLLNEYAEGFEKSFSVQLLQLYKEALLNYAINNKATTDPIDFLLGIEKMQELKGGKAAVQELAAEIKVQNSGLYQLLPASVKK